MAVTSACSTQWRTISSPGGTSSAFGQYSGRGMLAGRSGSSESARRFRRLGGRSRRGLGGRFGLRLGRRAARAAASPGAAGGRRGGRRRGRAPPAVAGRRRLATAGAGLVQRLFQRRRRQAGGHLDAGVDAHRHRRRLGALLGIPDAVDQHRRQVQPQARHQRVVQQPGAVGQGDGLAQPDPGRLVVLGPVVRQRLPIQVLDAADLGGGLRPGRRRQTQRQDRDQDSGQQASGCIFDLVLQLTSTLRLRRQPLLGCDDELHPSVAFAPRGRPVGFDGLVGPEPLALQALGVDARPRPGRPSPRQPGPGTGAGWSGGCRGCPCGPRPAPSSWAGS